jgi:hypothetical protein
MVKRIRLYIEGDKKETGKSDFVSLRQGFREFFDKWAKEENLNVGFDNNLLGDRGKAVNIFLKFVELYPKELIILLIDTEREKDINENAKLFLQKDFPNSDFKNIKEWQCHFMAQAMETWFLADKEKLAGCFDNKFKENALPKHKKIEKISKDDVLEKLKTATKDTSNGKGKYDKGGSAGKILREIRPHKVIDAAPHCEKLFNSIKEIIGK